MKLNSTIATLIAALTLSACGGGGGGSSTGSPAATTPTAPAAPVAPTTPATPAEPVTPTAPVTPVSPVPPVVAANPADPYTGQPATGTPTATVSGVVVSNVTVGATVTAYALKADGSNGAVLGVSALTGADGKFTMQLTSTPTGQVRFVAQSGVFVSEADGSKQANTALELVAPYITTDLNYFVITPATHLVSHVVSYQAKSGSDLTKAYLSGVESLLSITGANVILKGNARAGIDFLKTMPGSADDKLNTYQDLLTGIEWFAVRYDLPSSVAVRVLASHAEKRTVAGVDGSNAPINVGKWVNGVFDEKQTLTLDELMAMRNLDGTIMRSFDGTILHAQLESYLSNNLIQNFYRVKACADGNALPDLLTRYPGDAGIFANADLKAGVCAADAKELADIKALIATNNRSK
jgi:hypothetical protein